MNNDLLFQCLRIRKIEEAIATEYAKLEMRTPVHLSIGEEQVAVGVCSNLLPQDKVFGGHRSHAAYLACNGSLKALIAELMGKATGCSNGMGGSMHLQSDGTFVASTSIVGGTVPVAVGSAFADKIRGIPSVTVVFFGDGAMEEGCVHEAFNFASLHRLSVLFVCSNNGLAVTTPIQDRQNNHGLTAIAAAHGLGYEFCATSDVKYISKISGEAIERARSGNPQFIEVAVERQRVHCGIEWERDLVDDCLTGFSADETSIQKEIEDAFMFARSSPIPTKQQGVFA